MDSIVQNGTSVNYQLNSSASEFNIILNGKQLNSKFLEYNIISIECTVFQSFEWYLIHFHVIDWEPTDSQCFTEWNANKFCVIE